MRETRSIIYDNTSFCRLTEHLRCWLWLSTSNVHDRFVDWPCLLSSCHMLSPCVMSGEIYIFIATFDNVIT